MPHRRNLLQGVAPGHLEHRKMLAMQEFSISSDDNIILTGDSFTNGEEEWAGLVDSSEEFGSLDYFSIAGANLARLSSNFAANYDPDNDYSAVVIAGGVNDVAKDRTFDEMRDSVQSIISQRQNDEHVILTTIAPMKGVLQRSDPDDHWWTEVRQEVADQYDSWILNAAENSENITVFDIRSVLDTDGDLVIDDGLHNGDFLHPSAAGSELLAEAFIYQFDPDTEPPVEEGDDEESSDD